MPVGILPAISDHCTGVGVAPLLNVVLHPAVWKNPAAGAATATVTGAWAAITQLPVGGAGFGGTGRTDGVHPARDRVAVGVRLSETVTLQSGAVKFVA